MTKIIAHRGANKLAPENTLSAFRKAVELKSDGLETDIHLTKDGELVICHNYDINNTSDGEGFVAQMTLDELRKYDFSSYFSPEFAGEKIPTLDEFLEISRNLEIINIEIKVPHQKNDIVRKAIERVKAFNLEEQVLFSSFSVELMRESKEINPKIKTAALYDINSPLVPEISADPVAFCKKNNLDALHPIVLFIDKDFIDRCHSGGIKVNYWTLNDKNALDTVREMGVDGIITDVPEFFVQG